MLPGINYNHLSNEDLGDKLVDLEYETQVILSDLCEGIKDIMAKAKMFTVLEMMVAHLGAYLGFMSVAALGDAQAKKLKDKIIELITQEAKSSYKILQQYPITPYVKDMEVRRANLDKLRERAPGSIIVQTLRLGRVLLDVIDELLVNKSFSMFKKEQSGFVPTIPFMVLLKTKCKSVLKDLKEQYYEEEKEAKLYHINHTAVQIGWLIGYFSDMSGDGEDRIAQFLKYTCDTTAVYIEFGERFVKIPINKMKNMAEI
jgi:hypothetical protein